MVADMSGMISGTISFSQMVKGSRISSDCWSSKKLTGCWDSEMLNPLLQQRLKHVEPITNHGQLTGQGVAGPKKRNLFWAIERTKGLLSEEAWLSPWTSQPMAAVLLQALGSSKLCEIRPGQVAWTLQCVLRAASSCKIELSQWMSSARVLDYNSWDNHGQRAYHHHHDCLDYQISERTPFWTDCETVGLKRATAAGLLN